MNNDSDGEEPKFEVAFETFRKMQEESQINQPIMASTDEQFFKNEHMHDKRKLSKNFSQITG